VLLSAKATQHVFPSSLASSMVSINASSTLFQLLQSPLKPTLSLMTSHAPQSHLLFPLRPTQVDFAAVKLLELKSQTLLKVPRAPQQAQVLRQSELTPIPSTLSQLARRHPSLSRSLMISVLASQLAKATQVALPIPLNLVSASSSVLPLHADKQLELTPTLPTLSLLAHQTQSPSRSLIISVLASQLAKATQVALPIPLNLVSASSSVLPLHADKQLELTPTLPTLSPLAHQTQSPSPSSMTCLPVWQRAKVTHLALRTRLSLAFASCSVLLQSDADSNKVPQVVLPAVKEPRTHTLVLPRLPPLRTKELTRTPSTQFLPVHQHQSPPLPLMT
jgi:hypothetical protein